MEAAYRAQNSQTDQASGRARSEIARAVARLFAIAALVAGFSSAEDRNRGRSEDPIRVGTYEYPPLVFIDESGAPAGAFIEVIEHIAEEEGFGAIAALFRAIATVEKHHEKRYLALLENIEKGRVFKREVAIQWKCRNCGYVHEGMEAPQVCPACAHPKAYFEVLTENY